MKTQGLTLMQSKMSEIKVTKKTTGETTKANDQTFDSFIKNSAGARRLKTNLKHPKVHRFNNLKNLRTEPHPILPKARMLNQMK